MLVDLPKDDPEPEKIPGKICIRISRVPYDTEITIILPNGAEEYVPSDKAERLLRLHGVKDPEKIITHVWNFYNAVLYIDDPAYNATLVASAASAGKDASPAS